MSAFKKETRQCNYPGCSSTFECEQRSNRTMCDEHRGKKGTGTPRVDKEKLAEKLAQEMFEERAQAFIDQHIPLPVIPEVVLATRVEEMGFDTEQEAVALFSDLHYGSRIDKRIMAGLGEYNIDIARERLARWRTGILRFTQMSQLVIPLKTLNLFALGDDIEGHGAMFGSQALQMQTSAAFQVLGFIEDMSRILVDMLARYEHIRVFKVPGNHGRITARAKDSYPPDNLEIMAWRNIADRISNVTGGEWHTDDLGVECLEGGMVDFYITPSDVMFTKVLGWKHALRHGHGIGGLSRTYTGAKDNKRRLNSIIGEIVNYYVKAHLHEAESSEHEIQGEILQNGCFVGPSQLSVFSNMATANLPSQEFYLVHPRRGKTHHHRIHLAEVEEVRQFEWVGS